MMCIDKLTIQERRNRMIETRDLNVPARPVDDNFSNSLISKNIVAATGRLSDSRTYLYWIWLNILSPPRFSLVVPKNEKAISLMLKFSAVPRILRNIKTYSTNAIQMKRSSMRAGYPPQKVVPPKKLVVFYANSGRIFS